MKVLKPLGKKQSSNHQDWLTVWKHIQMHTDYDRAERLVAESAAKLQEFAQGKKVAYGWSGGKDSLAVGLVAQKAGIRESVLVTSDLEYPEFLTWVDNHRPDGLTIQNRSEINMDWLIKNQHMLFPDSSQKAATWFSKVQHHGQRDYAKNNNIEMLVLGRRRADGNYLGESLGSSGYVYRDGKGFYRFSPIGDWKHEDVLHVLAAFQQDLPPLYRWPRGFVVGSGPWPSRTMHNSIHETWLEIYEIDKSLVAQSAEAGLPGALEVLEIKGENG